MVEVDWPFLPRLVAFSFRLAVQLRFKTGNVLVVGFQGLPVARHGFIVDADLLLQHIPALGHAGKQIRQAFERFADNG